MSSRYYFHPAAEEELRNATARYENERPGLGDRFFAEVEFAIEQILESPDRWPILEDDVRLCCTKRFKYGLVYLWDDDDVTIVAVMHLHRKPGYWKRRLRKRS